MSITFKQLREANLARLPLFKNKQGLPVHIQPNGFDWTVSDWFMALVGEVGELGNLLKKIKRGDFTCQTVGRVMDEQVAAELADIQTYLDILAYRLGVDLGEATRQKFNEVSRRVECDVRIELRIPTLWMAPASHGAPYVRFTKPNDLQGWVPLYRD